MEEVSGVDAVRIRVSLFLRSRSAGPALLTVMLALTVLARIIPAAILVLDGERLLEHAKHSEPLAAGGRYAELYSIQAGAYVTA
jgi:ABC-type multidrug transport system fused ATPase/permease subunit